MNYITFFPIFGSRRSQWIFFFRGEHLCFYHDSGNGFVLWNWCADDSQWHILCWQQASSRKPWYAVWSGLCLSKIWASSCGDPGATGYRGIDPWTTPGCKLASELTTAVFHYFLYLEYFFTFMKSFMDHFTLVFLYFFLLFLSPPLLHTCSNSTPGQCWGWPSPSRRCPLLFSLFLPIPWPGTWATLAMWPSSSFHHFGSMSGHVPIHPDLHHGLCAVPLIYNALWASSGLELWGFFSSFLRQDR